MDVHQNVNHLWSMQKWSTSILSVAMYLKAIVRIRRLNWYAKRSDRMKNAKVRQQIANSFFPNTLYLKYLEKVKNHQVYHIYRKYYKNSTAHNSSCRTMKPFLNDLDLIDLRHSREMSGMIHAWVMCKLRLKFWLS